jgi:cytidylate kinase
MTENPKTNNYGNIIKAYNTLANCSVPRQNFQSQHNKYARRQRNFTLLIFCREKSKTQESNTTVDGNLTLYCHASVAILVWNDSEIVIRLRRLPTEVLEQPDEILAD